MQARPGSALCDWTPTPSNRLRPIGWGVPTTVRSGVWVEGASAEDVPKVQARAAPLREFGRGRAAADQLPHLQAPGVLGLWSGSWARYLGKGPEPVVPRSCFPASGPAAHTTATAHPSSATGGPASMALVWSVV